MTTTNYYERPTYNSLAEIFGNALSSGFLTAKERLQLRETLLQDAIVEDDLIIANRLLYALRRNFLKLAA
jgi:hypothetical protein